MSKWKLTEAAVESGNKLAYFGIICLLISALLTAIYMLSVVIRAFFPVSDFDYQSIEGEKDPGWKMCLPLLFCSVCVIILGLWSEPLIAFFQAIASGRI